MLFPTLIMLSVYTFIPFKQTCTYSWLVMYTHIYSQNENDGMYMVLELKFPKTFSWGFFYYFICSLLDAIYVRLFVFFFLFSVMCFMLYYKYVLHETETFLCGNFRSNSHIKWHRKNWSRGYFYTTYLCLALACVLKLYYYARWFWLEVQWSVVGSFLFWFMCNL